MSLGVTVWGVSFSSWGWARREVPERCESHRFNLSTAGEAFRGISRLEAFPGETPLIRTSSGGVARKGPPRPYGFERYLAEGVGQDTVMDLISMQPPHYHQLRGCDFTAALRSQNFRIWGPRGLSRGSVGAFGWGH